MKLVVEYNSLKFFIKIVTNSFIFEKSSVRKIP